MMKQTTLKLCLLSALGLSLFGFSQAQLSSTQLETRRALDVRKTGQDVMPDVKTVHAASEFVVLADIGESKSRWAGKKIVTDWDVRVRESLKGRAPKRLIVTTYGGEVDNIAQDFSHSAQLISGETAILFLAPISERSAKLSPDGHFVAYDTHGVVRVLETGQSKSRLENNRRLKRHLDKMKSDIRTIK